MRLFKGFFVVLAGLFIVLWKLLFPVILKMTEEREARIKKDQEEVRMAIRRRRPVQLPGSKPASWRAS